MTVDINTLAVIPYTGNDTTGLFAVTFPTFQDSDVEVYIEDVATGLQTLGVLATDYSLQDIGIPNQNSQVTLIDAAQAWIGTGNNLNTGFRILIKFNSQAYQIANLANLGRFAPVEFGKAVDRLTMHVKSLRAVINRGLIISDQDKDAGFDPLLPSAVGQGGKILTINVAEDAWEYGPTVASIFAAEAAAIASAAAALISETNALNSANAAAISEIAAAASAAAALVSEGNALASENAASGFADDSEYFSQLSQFDSQVQVSNASSPIAITAGDDGKLYLVDTTAGDVVFNMPALGTVPAGFKIGTLKVVDSLNDILVNPDGAETIAGLAQRISTQVGVGILLTPDLALATNWEGTFFASGFIAANALGGGGMTINALQSVAANGTLTPTTDLQQLLKVAGLAGAQIANIAPFSSPPFDGAIITLLGQSDANPIEFKFSNTAEGLILNGDANLGLNDSLTIVYDQVAQRFYEQSRRIN